MNVSELIAFLQTQPQHLTVAYQLHSEQCEMKADDIRVEELGRIRPDGWIPCSRPDEPIQKYLVFPGN